MPIGTLLSSLIRAGAMYAASELIFRGNQGQKKIKDIVLSIVWLLVAAYLGVMSLTGFLLTLFFYFADIHNLVTPALVTSIIVLLLGLLAGNESRRRFRRR